ncbi:TPA: Crp/Fnr family transcriptional regulator [bacterium]|nr:Crp/Fnr family transcriptional regulator [bacterium]
MRKSPSFSERADFLRLVPIFSSLSLPDLQELSLITDFCTYKKGCYIFTKDDVGASFFIIKNGSAKVVIDYEDGKEITLSLLHPKDIFGELSILDGMPRSATVIAMDDCEILSIERTKFIDFLKDHPDVCIKILEVLSKRVRKADAQIEALVLLKAEEKVAYTLLGLAREYGKKKEGEVLIDIKINHYDIGNMCGIRRETSNRIISGFIKNGIIKREKKKIIILDEVALYRILKKEVN